MKLKQFDVRSRNKIERNDMRWDLGMKLKPCDMASRNEIETIWYEIIEWNETSDIISWNVIETTWHEILE